MPGMSWSAAPSQRLKKRSKPSRIRRLDLVDRTSPSSGTPPPIERRDRRAADRTASRRRQTGRPAGPGWSGGRCASMRCSGSPPNPRFNSGGCGLEVCIVANSADAKRSAARRVASCSDDFRHFATQPGAQRHARSVVLPKFDGACRQRRSRNSGRSSGLATSPMTTAYVLLPSLRVGSRSPRYGRRICRPASFP